MLVSLTIQNIVLIEKLGLKFASGLSILTGETGAGKSILIDSLGLVLGNRAESRLLRSGAEKAQVTAEFDISKVKKAARILKQNDIDFPNDELMIRRIITADGRNKAYLNDSPVSINLLQEVAETLIEIHGQHDQKGLLNPGNHLSMLDSYADIEAEVAEMGNKFSQWRDRQIELEKVRQEVEKAQAESDYLQHAMREIEQLDPQPGEEQSLAEKRAFMQSREKIIETLNAAMAELNGNTDVMSSLQTASRILSKSTIKSSEDIFRNAVEQLDKATIEAGEAIAQIEKLSSAGDIDTEDLERLEERLFALRDLARKHRKTVDELPQFKQELERKLSLIESGESRLAELEKQVAVVKKEYSVIADKISSKRQEAAKKLKDVIAEELAPLKMAGCKMQVELQALEEDKWSASGKERAQFLVQTNPGSAFGPLHKIASGGELSRFMLALKVVLSDVKSTPTLIFDEIDTGVGGATADAVGKRLSMLGKKFQVLTITHQPQVAAYGDQHMRVEKHQRDGSTVTSVQILSGKAKMEEVARMLAGAKITKEARAAAGKLMGAE